MASHQSTTDAALDRLIEAADSELERVVTDYEPLEVAYRAATQSAEVFPEVVNTTMLPAALITTATSAR